MAFHTACPITLRKICYCELGFPGKLRERRAREEFLEEVSRVEDFLRDPWTLRIQDDDGGGTVEIPVPRLLAPAAAEDEEEDCGGGGGEEVAAAVPARGESAWALSVKARREELRQQAAAAREAAEEYIRKLEAGVLADVPGETPNDLLREDQGSSEIKIICRICFSGENESSERAKKMLPCKTCNKKYHRSCLKIWAEYRDLFHWSSWTCPSCRVCQVCRKPGDPTKLMYCKRCDDAYHCYCLQPPHKNVSHGPYLCPKHTWCHSCGSTVSGSGHSTRWFLSYTCCDACGRLFVKGKYCPVCLKVYRDSEMTPMVCCDVCQRWVHCVCDGISDEKYQQFQRDGNLYYKCAACRGDCYQVKDTDDAVRELWRRKDKADRDLTARLRSVAGLPTQEEIFSISPFSDDDESGTLKLKNEHGGSLKFSVKGLGDKTPKTSKDFGKILSPSIKNAKKGHQVRSDGQEILSSPNIGSDIEKPLVDKETSSTKEDVVNSVNMMPTFHKKGTKTQSLHFKEGAAKNAGRNETAKGTKLVILLGAKGKNTTTSARPDASSCQREQDFATSNGPGDTSQQEDGKNVKLETPSGVDRFVIGEGARLDNAAITTSSEHEERENNVVKLRLVSDMHRKSRNNMSEENKHSTVQKSPLILREKSEENKDVLPSKQSVGPPINCQSQNHDASDPLLSNFPDDPKPLLKLKFKNPYFEQRNSLSSQAVASQGVEMKNAVKGQRSKRKRPSLEKSAGTLDDDSYSQPSQKKSIDEVLDANWILQKLGKDAIGKRVEVHQSSDDSWQKGMVSDVIEGGSSLLVHLDDGSPMTLTLGRQGIRLIAQKQKRTKAVVRAN